MLPRANIPFHRIVGSGQSFHIVAVEQTGSLALCHGEKMLQAALLVCIQGPTLGQVLQIARPVVEALSDLGGGQDFLGLTPLCRQDAFCLHNPTVHAFERLEGVTPPFPESDDTEQTGEFLLALLAQRPPFFASALRLASISASAS